MRKKLVIIDDEDDIREVLRQALEFARDWEVLDESDGEAGLALIGREHPDAVLLDVMMPKMDGREILKALQTNAETMAIPVIFITASLQRQEVRELEKLGPKAVLAKPFDPLTIAEEVEKILGWRAPQ